MNRHSQKAQYPGVLCFLRTGRLNVGRLKRRKRVSVLNRDENRPNKCGRKIFSVILKYLSASGISTRKVSGFIQRQLQKDPENTSLGR